MVRTSRTVHSTIVAMEFTCHEVHTLTHTTPTSLVLITSPLKETNSTMVEKSVTCGLAPTHMLMIWLLPETGSTVRHLKKDSKHTAETTSESLLRTITSTVRKLQSRCWESMTTQSTTTKSSELQKTVKQESKQRRIRCHLQQLSVGC